MTCDNFWFKNDVAHMIHNSSCFLLELAGTDVTAMPSVTCMDWLHYWYNHMAHLVSSSTDLAILTNVRNVNLHHLVQSKCKISKQQSLLQRN